MEAEEDEEAKDKEMKLVEDSNVDGAWVRFNCVEEQRVTFDDFVAVDVLVAGEMSDSDIVSMVKEKHTEHVDESEDEEDVAADPPPPPSDALNSLDMLRRFVES